MKLLSVLLVVICILIATTVTDTLQCAGRININIVYENTEVQQVQLEGIDLLTAHPVGTPLLTKLPTPTKEDYAGQNYVTIHEHHIQLFPAGKLGINILYLFDLLSKTWDTISVHCPPLGAAYVPSRDGISGFCAVNTNYSGKQCVPYFTLQLKDGKWIDTSEFGYCSNPLSTTDLTNPVILQNFSTDYEAHVVKLYFAERGRNILHEVNLVECEAEVYDMPKYGNHVLGVNHLIPVITKDDSFFGLRIESLINNSSGVYQTLVSSSGSALQFAGKTIHTPSVTFNSYNLDYLVTFANNKTIVIIREEGTLIPFPLKATLQYPILCHNMPIGPNTHYMICRTSTGGALLININDREVTSKIIPNGNSSIVGMGGLTDSAFYLLNDRNEMLFFLLDTDLLQLGYYTVPSVNIRVVNSSGRISCSDLNDTSKKNDFNNMLTIIIVTISVLGVILLIVLVISVLVKHWKRKGFKTPHTYEKIDDSETSSNDSSNSVDPPEQPPDQSVDQDHTLDEASSINVTDQLCLPRDSCRGINDQSGYPSSTTDHFTVTMESPRQCTNDDPEIPLPSESRLPPVGAQTN